MLYRSGLWGLFFALVLVLALSGATQAQTKLEADRLDAEVKELRQSEQLIQAVPLAQRALALREKELGLQHPDVGMSVGMLALLYMDLGEHSEAETLFRRSLEIFENAFGPEDRQAAVWQSNLGVLYLRQGRYAEAEPLFAHAIATLERALGGEHEELKPILNNLGTALMEQGRFSEAEKLIKRSLAISERASGLESLDFALSLNNLAAVYLEQNLVAEAEPLLVRSLAIAKKAVGPQHSKVGTFLNNLADCYFRQGCLNEAAKLYFESLDIAEKVYGVEHIIVARLLNNLADVYRTGTQDTKLPERLIRRSLGTLEKALGPNHPELGVVLGNLANLVQVQGRYAEAEIHRLRSLAILENALGPDHSIVAEALDGLADFALAQHDLQRAEKYWARATAILQRRAERGLAGSSAELSKGETQQNSRYFSGLVKVTRRLATEKQDTAQYLASQMFETAQWSQGSEAAASLAQMAARSATGSRELAAAVRERQDLVAEWRAKDKSLIAARSEAPDKRNAAAEKKIADRVVAIDARLTEIDAHLAKYFPDYAALTSPKPISLTDVQASLRDDEALLLFLDTVEFKPLPEETFIWVVTKIDSRWVRSDVGTKALSGRIATLRCGLDDGAWNGDGQARCNALFGFDHQAPRPRTLPFDLHGAHALYKDLLGGVEDLIKDKHLLVVPSGPLTQLPFQVLVTDSPASPGDYANAAWLTKRHAITVLPSVASLAALRRNAKSSAAPEPFIGYGDPVLSGQPGCGKITIPDRCPDEEIKVAEEPSLLHRIGTALAALPTYFRNGQANVAEVRKLCPLPDTAHELKCVARSLNAPGSSIVLAKDMTEAAVKRAPLDRYRVVHFATHGLVAGETAQLAKDKAEPALVFTPPDAATEEDDGLLTASEVAGLKLDADWVVMSACNTASGGAPGAEALSGLARAFFYAGARALLVSHWPVDSYAATMLTSHTFAEMRKDSTVARSEAFRRAMLALMSDSIRPWASHPSVWGPFVVVGEGGSRVLQ